MKISRFAMVAMVLAFAGATLWAGSTNEVSEAEVNVNPAGVLPIVDETLTLRVFVAQAPAVLDYNDNYQTQYMEEKTNIKIDWMLVPSTQAIHSLHPIPLRLLTIDSLLAHWWLNIDSKKTY